MFVDKILRSLTWGSVGVKQGCPDKKGARFYMIKLVGANLG